MAINSQTRKQANKNVAARTKIQTRKQGKIPAAVVLAFLSENHAELPTADTTYTEQEDIFRVRLILWKTPSRLQRFKKAAAASKIPAALTDSTLTQILAASTQAKYAQRPSPPFSAAALCGATLKGNDKSLYQSVKRGQACAWVQV